MLAVGRKRINGKGLPKGVVVSRGWYFLKRGNRWTKLAREGELREMYSAIALILDSNASTYAPLFDRYEREVLPTKAAATCKDQRRQLQHLRAVFGNSPKGSITARDVRRLIADNGGTVSIRRTVALLSHVHTMAIEWGDDSIDANPCLGLTNESKKARAKRKPPAPPALDAVMLAWMRASKRMRVAMALGYVTGLRRGDLVRLRDVDAGAKGVTVTMNKTGKSILLQWTPNLRAAWDYAIQQRGVTPVRREDRYLICDSRGRAVSGNALRLEWNRLKPGFEFKALRTLSANEHADGSHLGHTSPHVLARHYRSAPTVLKPI